MKVTTVLFDLDGTLLPMDTDAFMKLYFGLMVRKLSPLGYSADALVGAIWKGTEAMVRNDGSCTNEEVFWKCYTGLFGADARKDEPCFEEFYRQEFAGVQAACGFEPMAARVISRCKELGLKVVLATNPLFPAIATHSRVRWAGLKPDAFAHITTYENASFCKPNLDYYRQVLEKVGVKPEECLMVGNDVAEDMVAEKLGMRVFLLTPCLLNKHGEDYSRYPQGGFPELFAYLEALASA